MKNTIKMSLAAALAVSALSTSAAAKPLEEAIKGVDVSGSMVYRYDERSIDTNTAGVNSTDTAANYYKIGLTTKAKVNDIVTANVRVITGDGILHQTNDKVGLGVGTTPDGNPSLNVVNANFSANIAGATVIAGKQGLTTPWTQAVSTDDSEQTGTGALALVPVGPVTIAAAYFNQTNLNNAGAGLDGTEAIATTGILGTVGPVSLDAWYLNMGDTNDGNKNGFDSYTVGAKAKVAMAIVEARYTSLSLNTANPTTKSEDNSLAYVKASAKFGPIGVNAGYGMTDEDGGLTALDIDAKTTFEGWNVVLNNKADSDMWIVGANADLMAGLNLKVYYDTLDNSSAKNTEDEIVGQLTYQMSKNFSTYLRYSTYTIDPDIGNDIDRTRGRLQVKYTF